MLQENNIWTLGDGHSVRFWLDNWLGIGSIRGWAQGPLRIDEEENVKARDLVLGDRWDLSRSSVELPEHVINRILSIPVPVDDLEDFLIPTFVDHNGFSLARAYTYLIDQPRVELDWLWKSKVEPKIKFFLWLLWWDRLPHKFLLALRKITPDSMCPRCKYPNENSMHMVCDCLFSVPVEYDSNP